MYLHTRDNMKKVINNNNNNKPSIFVTDRVVVWKQKDQQYMPFITPH